ncbi:efflux RND transporter periplasmic adaptor subunit [Aeoliella sp. ICT_H6.2]|uniref:Efflux RND transporter periplasmic adaptor subunit n=1 Tax=Aeoliella straminimaris TaxID=2954799 RepID=A0A9X2FDF0_9BACT|nr:efflux RND transporter periplasmic adaptor subunit [Aeoliella straminimaris]MCO6046163.1 efflux RND transporter periplasmic adaptor subunit [Aeoliella straminimaris]
MRPAASNPTDTPPADQSVWDDLSLVLDGLDDLARSQASPDQFYRQLIGSVAPLLAANHAAVWLREPDGTMRIVAHTSGWAESIADRQNHEALVTHALDAPGVLSLAPGQSLDVASNASSDHLLLAPVTLSDWTAQADAAVAVIELALPAGRAPSSYAGAVELMQAIRAQAAEYHVRRRLAQLSSESSGRDALLSFAEQIGGTPDLGLTAQRIASEGARIARCDRLSVLRASRRSARLLATSGTDRVERRGRAARALERLATIAMKLDEPIYYADSTGEQSTTDSLPQVDDVVGRYVDEFHARSLMVLPMPADAENQSATRGVLVAEQFSAERGSLDQLLLGELARAAAPAMTSALAWHDLPLGGVLRTLGWLRMPRTLFRLAAACLVMAAVVTALLAIPAPLTVDVRGHLVPSARQEVFAPRSAIVDEVLVAHSDSVDAGATLTRLRDPELGVEIERIRGEQIKVQRQLESVRATRTTADATTRDPLEIYKLSAEEEELKTQRDNLQAELALLETEAESLVVTSPLAGTVTTWQVDERLAEGRPVERGQVLLSVAQTDGDWILELEVPDERLDMLRSAESDQLQVEYRLGSDSSTMHTATVTRIADRVDLVNKPTGEQERTVLVEATPDAPLSAELRAAALRPGGSVRARIVVGEAPLGYVLTSDLWRSIRNWWEF